MRDLVGAGLTPATIRDAESHLQAETGMRRPFASEEIYTDGVDVLWKATPAIPDQLTAANRRGQEVLLPTIQNALRGVGYADGIATTWKAAPSVVVDPTVQYGEPCVAGTGVRTARLWALARRGQTAQDLAKSYELSLAAVRAALKFEDRRRQVTA